MAAIAVAFAALTLYLVETLDRAEAELIVKDLDMETVQAGLADGSILVIDVREAHEFAAGHIPGSVLMPLSQFDPGAIPDQPGKRVVFSCAAGVRSLRALEFAQSAGVDVDSHYRGGFKDWLGRGGLVETD